jgi:hypothetical protein
MVKFVESHGLIVRGIRLENRMELVASSTMTELVEVL